MRTNLLSSNVQKLGDMPGFNLPALKTCPGKTELCSKYCYATRMHFRGPTVIRKYAYNWTASRTDDFEDRMIAEIELLRLQYKERGRKIDRFRIHSSGDFYSQDYIDKWYRIIRKFPTIQFTAYTRSHMLDFRRKPKNLNLFYSMDQSTEHGKPQGVRLTAQVFPRAELPDPDKKHFICKSKCYKCKACYLPGLKMGVIFKRH